MLKNNWISKNLNQNEKIVKKFASPKRQTALGKLFNLTPNPPTTRLNLITSLKQNISYGDIQKYTHLLSKGFKNAVLGRQEMVQCKCFFWH